MGEVYLADDVQENRKVALKMLTAAGMDDDALRRFKREIQLCSSCQHPGIVRIYDYGVNGSQPYYVMEVLDGWSLDRCVRRGEPLEVEQAVTVGIQVGEALAYLHGRGMLHRDIKPHNVFFDKSGQAKLVDFGLAWSSSATCITRTGQILGSPRYLSPEMVRGDELDERADLFQYGLVLYEIITGSARLRRRVGSRRHAEDRQGARGTAPEAESGGGPADFETVIDNLLAKEPRRSLPEGRRARGRPEACAAGRGGAAAPAASATPSSFGGAQRGPHPGHVGLRGGARGGEPPGGASPQDRPLERLCGWWPSSSPARWPGRSGGRIDLPWRGTCESVPSPAAPF